MAKFVIFLCSICFFQATWASECGDASLPGVYKEADAVLLAKNVFLPLSVDAYRKLMSSSVSGARGKKTDSKKKDKATKIEIYEQSLGGGERPAVFTVIRSYKGSVAAGDVLRVKDSISYEKYGIGNDYILFLSSPKAHRYWVDDCLYADFSRQIVFKDSSALIPFKSNFELLLFGLENLSNGRHPFE